ncbi:MAG: hypothetical protein AB9900_01610 [Humidesulfovibrio sp.]
MGESTVIVFDHIPKCAGTTFEVWLTAAYGGKRVYAHCPADYVALMRQGSRDFKVVADHYTWATHCFLPAELNVAYVTMIREPLQAAISLYNFTRNQLSGEYGTDINTYLLDYRSNLFTNHLGQGSLRAAMEKLFETYAAFGIVERYRQSLDVIADTLGLAAVPRVMEKRNVSQGARHEISDAVREIFMAENADDYALYAAAERELVNRAAGIERAPGERVPEPSGREAVVFTGTLPDVRACLDAQEYSQALSLMGEKHLDTLPRHMLLFAGQLAQKLGDIGKARLLYEKMQSAFAHTFTDYYAGFLLSIGERAQAVALIDAELKLFDAVPSIPQDSKFFEYYVRFQCLLISACWHEAPERAEASIRLLAAYCDVSEQAFVALLNVLRDVGAYARSLEVYRAFEHVSRNNPALVYTAMITVCYQGGMFAEAQDFCSRLLAVSPNNHQAIRTLIVMDRKSGRFAMNLEPYEELARRLEGTAQASAILREAAMHHYENNNPGNVFSMAKLRPDSASSALLEASCRNNGVVDFGSVKIGNLLVIKSGPNIVFDGLYEELLQHIGKKFDIIGMKSRSAAEKYALVDSCVDFPGVRYMHDAHIGTISMQLRKKKYEDCIVVMSDFSMISYGEIFKLASALAASNIYAYSFSHVLSGKYRNTLLMLSQGTGQALR